MTRQRQHPAPPRPLTIAVTGGARGIGRATARELARRGHRVVIGDLDAEVAAEAAASLAQRATVRSAALDVSSRDSFRSFLDEAEAVAGPLDVLVNNAGIMPTGSFLDETDTMTDRLVAVNLMGVIHGSRLAAERFSTRGGGHLVNVASLAGVGVYPGVATYCGTKHAVVGFSGALRRELAPAGIRVTTVLPGVVRTELSAGADIPRWARPFTTVEPDDVARAIADTLHRDVDRLTVPRKLGALLAVTTTLPSAVRDRIERATRMDQAFTADNAQRRAYHARLDRQVRR